HIALHRVWYALGGVLNEMMVLTSHRAETGHLPEQPLHDLEAAPHVGRQEAAGFLGEVLKDGARLEHADRCAAIGRLSIDNRWNAIVGSVSEEIRLELLSFADIDRVQPVGLRGLLQKDRDLVSVWGGPIV